MTHADIGLMQKFQLQYEVMKTWDITLWIIFGMILSVVVYVSNFVITSYYKAGVL